MTKAKRFLLGFGLLCTAACASTRETGSGEERSQQHEQYEPDAAQVPQDLRGDDGDRDAVALDGSTPVVHHDAGPSPLPVVDRDASAPVEVDAGEPSSGADTLALTPCPEEDASACPASDPLCFWEGGPSGGGGGGPDGFHSLFTGWSMCTRFCESDADCPSDIGAARCIEATPGGDRICLFECTFGRSCPGELSCSNGGRCAHHFCECTGIGCEDPLCTRE